MNAHDRVLLVVCLLFVALTIGFGIGGAFGMRTERDRLEAFAVSIGAAEWRADKNGRPEIYWFIKEK